MSEEISLFNIGVVERETGIGKDTLRVWEKRYGFPLPVRDQHEDRLYPAEQVDQLRLIKRLLDIGMRPVGHGVLIGLTFGGRFTAGNQRRPFVFGKSGQFQIETGLMQFSQFEAQQVLVPFRILTNLVVGQDQRAALDVGEVCHWHDRHLDKPELACREQSSVAGDHVVAPVDQNRRTPTEFADAGGDLRHLGIRMLFRIARMRNQDVDGTIFDLQSCHGIREIKNPPGLTGRA